MIKNYKIKKVLIANRGEIALRIQRTCHRLGIRTVIIASEADAGLSFALQANGTPAHLSNQPASMQSTLEGPVELSSELAIIGPAAAKESYLAGDKIIRVALERSCDAVHPGYGFLSENADFAAKVVDAGLIYIGPTAEAIAGLGSKTEARRRVVERGVPVTPGTAGNLSDQEIINAAIGIGFPVIIKAVAGGGGRGMRVVGSAEELREMLPRARAEALKNFSSDLVFVEKFIEQPRHVEVQIFGDTHGNLIHFGTRDCSTQRRHQKLIEEAPAPHLPAELRRAIENAAIEAARSFDYVNAGTAEFLVKDGEFYFLEMNTRIQVEHPVTEVITGLDLVELQLQVASGHALTLKQKDVKFDGHAIEFRIYAEDPSQNFAPAKGLIQSITSLDGSNPESGAGWFREDRGVEAGDTVSLHYDALLSKLIIHARSRPEALERAREALNCYSIEGFPTTIPFHKWMLWQPKFWQGPVDIKFVERCFSTKCLEELSANVAKDPRHKPVLSPGVESVETSIYSSKKFKFTYNIQIRHEAGGTFLVGALRPDGCLAKPEFCRRSNGLATALESLKEEVLEVMPAEAIFP